MHQKRGKDITIAVVRIFQEIPQFVGHGSAFGYQSPECITVPGIDFFLFHILLSQKVSGKSPIYHADKRGGKHQSFMHKGNGIAPLPWNNVEWYNIVFSVKWFLAM